MQSLSAPSHRQCISVRTRFLKRIWLPPSPTQPRMTDKRERSTGTRLSITLRARRQKPTLGRRRQRLYHYFEVLHVGRAHHRRVVPWRCAFRCETALLQNQPLLFCRWTERICRDFSINRSSWETRAASFMAARARPCSVVEDRTRIQEPRIGSLLPPSPALLRRHLHVKTSSSTSPEIDGWWCPLEASVSARWPTAGYLDVSSRLARELNGQEVSHRGSRPSPGHREREREYPSNFHNLAYYIRNFHNYVYAVSLFTSKSLNATLICLKM